MADETQQLQTGRDERGRFLSKRKLQDIALRQLTKQSKATETARKTIDRLTKSTSQQAKTVTKLIKTQQKQYKAQSKGLKQGQKETARAIKDLRKMATQTQKSADRQIKAYQKIAREKIKAMRAGMKGAKGGGGGISVGLGPLAGIIGVGAIIAAITKMSDLVTEIARGRDMANALGGSFRRVTDYLPNRRDVALFTEFASQGFSNRFAGKTEIEGLKTLRDTLQEKLGESAGTELTLQLTESLKNSRAELQQFLAMASQDVPRALEVFQSADIETFATALNAARQRGDEMSETAFTLEKAWRDVKDSFETFVKDFVKTHHVDLKNVVQDIAQGLVDLINWGRRLAAEFKPVFDFIAGGFRIIRDAAKGLGYIKDIIATDIDMVSVRSIDKRLDGMLKQQRQARDRGDTAEFERLKTQIRTLMRERQRIMGGANERLRDPVSDVKDLTLGIAENVEQVKLKMTDVTAEAKKQRDELEKMATPIERAVLAMQKLDEVIGLQDARVALEQSRMAVIQSSPFGFGQSFEQTIRTAEAMSQRIAMLQRKYEAQST